MKTSRKELGDLGEQAASDYLMGQGHIVLDRNWRTGHLELDIITLDRKGVHFVEVKSRVAPVSADPLENVTAVKQRRMVAAAQKYIYEKKLGGREIFFDVISVVFDASTTHIDYYQQAFIPIYV